MHFLQFWAFSDIKTGKVLMRVAAGEEGSRAATCAQFHPDGLIFGTGTQDSIIKIWDLKERQNVANFPGHNGPISTIAFSENGKKSRHTRNLHRSSTLEYLLLLVSDYLDVFAIYRFLPGHSCC